MKGSEAVGELRYGSSKSNIILYSDVRTGGGGIGRGYEGGGGRGDNIREQE